VAAINPSPAPAAVQGADAAKPDLALVIRDDKAAGEYVYETVDTGTGQVVNQWPSQQMLQLRASDSYSPGEIVQQVA
jgi:hypothetical protein